MTKDPQRGPKWLEHVVSNDNTNCTLCVKTGIRLATSSRDRSAPQGPLGRSEARPLHLAGSAVST